MLGIKEIASYIPEKLISNYSKKEKFKIDDIFIETKIGIKSISKKDAQEKSSDLCVKAFDKLNEKCYIEKNLIDCCIVVTQNPDYNIPHTSAIVHGKLNLAKSCASFDISLGCSGYVYALSNILAFMKYNNLKKGLLFTSDPYSDIIDNDDKNTDLIFGDASTVTYIDEDGLFYPLDFSFGTDGSNYKEILCEKNLYMNGRAVFNFTATTIPKMIKTILEKNTLDNSNIDLYILHQGSKYIVDTITKRLKLDKKKVPFDIYEYGNTISSSIPIILEKELHNNENNTILLSAYGIGLSWANTILKRI
jgi:3-oxoacyl-[acyl-carrier-protein] synthase-3